MKVTSLAIPDVVLIEPTVFGDERGFFFESFNQAKFDAAIGRQVNFVQDNHSRSVKNVLRGLHYSIERPQGKLVRVLSGAILDVAVDIRKSSPTFGRSVCIELNGTERHQLWIPPGFAHGFLVLSETADVLYKVTDYYDAKSECCIAWNDTEIGVRWPLDTSPILSGKDQKGLDMNEAELFS